LKIQLYNNDKTTLYPQQVLVEILRKIKRDAEDFLGYKVENAVNTSRLF
jgi:molecular chaperone DnaK (HSP70)